MSSSIENSSCSFTKHFDSKNASFYYHDSVSNTTTWDKPLGEMAIYRSEYDLTVMHKAEIKHLAKQKEKIRQRKEVFDEFHKEREYELRIDKEDYVESEIKRIHGFWRVAALDASTSGQLSLSWNKELLFIDPLVYNFHENFGRYLVTLRLVGLSLTSIPEEFGLKLASLECLSLASNQLTTLPDNFILLTNLQELNLLNNRLISLPERIGLMCSLKNIEIANNCIKALPITFAALDKLIRVNFECNHLKVLPENLDNMLRCKSLNFNNNRLIRLPRCIARMPSLVSLSASKNVISYIPQELFDSPTVRIIRLSANQIRFIPDNIGDLKKLKELTLDFNLLSTLPLSIHKLRKLKTLRIEGNLSLTDPPIEIIAQGAQGVVAYYQEKVKNNEEWRIRCIVTSTQDCLQQVLDRGLADSSEFEAYSMIPGDADPYFAFQMPFFWSHWIVNLRDIWKVEGLQGIIDNKYKTASFPYTEREVIWAFNHFSDAYGPLLKKGHSLFKKCSCVKDGKRYPCIPPKMDFMCKRVCTLIKMQLVFQEDRSNRLWIEYKTNNLNDAIKRAKNEAEIYLVSKAGKEWLAAEAAEQANTILTAAAGVGRKKGWRLKIANKKKKGIINGYDKRIKRLKSERDKRMEAMKTEVAKMKEDLATPDMVPEGFIKVHMRAKVQNITMQLGNMEEDVQLKRLMLLCEQECDVVDDDIYEQGVNHVVEEDSSSGTSDSEESDDEAKALKVENVRRVKQELRERGLLRAKTSFDIEEAAKRARSFVPYDSVDKTLISTGQSAFGATLKITKSVADIAAKRVEAAANDMIDEEYKETPEQAAMRIAEAEKARKAKKDLMKRLKRRLRGVRDTVDARAQRIYRSTSGSAVELIRELSHEYLQQYLRLSIADAREKAERDLAIIDGVRANMSGVGVKNVFEAWKAWVKSKYERYKKDEEIRYAAELKDFSTAMTSVHIAEVALADWKKCVDIYTDEVYWQHSVTSEVSVDEPGVQHYLPAHFVIPPIPTRLKVPSKDDKRKLLFDESIDFDSASCSIEASVEDQRSPLTGRTPRDSPRIDGERSPSPQQVKFSTKLDTGESIDNYESDDEEGDDDSMEEYEEEYYDEFGDFEQVEDHSDDERSGTIQRTASMAFIPADSTRSMVRMAGISGLGNGSYKNMYSRGSMNSMAVSINSGGIQDNSSVNRHGSVRTLIGRRMNKNGAGSSFISKDDPESSRSTNTLQLTNPTFPSKPSSLPLLPLLALTAHTHGRPISPDMEHPSTSPNRLSLRSKPTSPNSPKRVSINLAKPTSPHSQITSTSRPASGAIALQTPSANTNLKRITSHRLSRKSMRKSQARLKAAETSLDTSLTVSQEIVIAPITPTSPKIQQLTPSQIAYTLLSNVVPDNQIMTHGPLSKPGSAPVPPLIPSVSHGKVPLSGIKGRIARALLKNTPAGYSLVNQLQSSPNISPFKNDFPLSSYGKPPVKNTLTTNATELQRMYKEANIYLNTKPDDGSEDGISQHSGSLIVKPEDEYEEAEPSRLANIDREYLSASRAVREERDRLQKARRETYLHKPPVKTQTLETIGVAGSISAKEDRWNEEKRLKLKELESKSNKYNYDLNNLRLIEGATLPPAHLLIMAANGVDTTGIIESNNVDHRTALAYKAVAINEALTLSAIKQGLIKEPEKKTWYEREVGPMFHKRYESSDSSGEEQTNSRGKNGKKGVKTVKKDKETRDKEKLARILAKKVEEDKKQAESDALDAKIFAKLNRQHD